MLVGLSPPESPESSFNSKQTENFQRRKIGSIRDNTKLFKILQQFENACQEEDKISQHSRKSSVSQSSIVSAPCSFTSKDSVEEFFKLGSTVKNKPPVTINHGRRFSDGDTVENNQPIACKVKGMLGNRNARKVNDSNKRSKNPVNSCKDSLPKYNQNSVGKSIVSECVKKPNSSLQSLFGKTQEKSSFPSKEPEIYHHHKINDKSKVSHIPAEVDAPMSKSKSKLKGTEDVVSPPPPIPKRGLSLPVSPAIKSSSNPDEPKSKLTPPQAARTPASPRNVIKQDSVKKAIQIYEGLSTTPKSQRKRSSYPRVVMKKEVNVDTRSARVVVTRKLSKKNSFRQSKNNVKDDSKKVSANPKSDFQDICYSKHSKEDSGVGFSDTEDSRTPQGIYQTLCGMTPTGDQCDTYDRLNRIHDMVNRIHKGQLSTCAACRAIPTGSIQLPPTSGPSSLLHIKCNEMAPHHHPPCICFSCQHSVFSCSQNTLSNNHSFESALQSMSLNDDESLYYNMCCLSGLTRNSWRQSRRRPVCEQNGRVCVVNCDMEKRNNSELYERLFDWNTCSTKETPAVQLSKHFSDDSDEGWVDITDSEDEKAIWLQERSLPVNDTLTRNASDASSKTLVPEENGDESRNTTYDHKQAVGLYSRLGPENISRATSSEHLYETIADLEAQNCSDSNNEIVDVLQSKVDTCGDNDPDSGEWSTESSSPTPIEQENSPIEEKPSPTLSELPVSRFSVGSETSPLESSSKRHFRLPLGKKNQAPKKKMSKFFVPWLVSNTEYVASRSPKPSVKKQNSRTIKVDNSPKATKTFTKSKRSQSIPSCVNGTSLSCTKIFSSTEILDRCKSDMKELDGAGPSADCPESSMSLSLSSISSLSVSQGSLASSTYLRPDQLNIAPLAKPRPSVSGDAIDVSVERVFKRCPSGESMHSYIVFRPVKEEDVPLYQFYERNMKERVALCRSPDGISSPVMLSPSVDIGATYDCSSHRKATPLRPQLSVVEQLSLDAKDIKMLWCELPEVKDSGILERISAQELKLQEAAFEFIQSQASYIRSLKVLYEYFICVPEFSDVRSTLCVLSKHEHDVLFSDIIGVKEVSERLMAEVTARWSDGILIPDICDIIYRHATMPSFSVYIKYCSNRVYQERTLKELKETRLCFLEVLRKLESNPACQGLSLESFLFLPMQHIARLPLLLDSIFRWLSSDSPSFSTCKMALEAVHKTFMECNDGARKMERLEEMFILNKQLEFKECKAIPLISASRWLLKRGELVKLEFDKKTFGRSSRCVRVPLYVFLFNDLLIITKRKSDDCYLVLDYCLRDKIQAIPVDAKDLQQPDLVPGTCRYLMSITLMSNHQGNSVEIILNCTLLSERSRWLESIHPVPQNRSCEVWEYDCPQVQCVRSYIAQQPDELSLQESDVVTIYRKMNDGWYEGRRLRDGMQGWFPASYTMDIPCSRARASNLRQCYRLLMLSQKHEAGR